MPRQIKQHDITYTASLAQRAAADVADFLETTWPGTVAVHNVEEENVNPFRERRTSTPVGGDKRYVTVGRSAPINTTLLDEVAGVLKFRLDDGQWEHVA